MWRLVLAGLILAGAARADRLELPAVVERMGAIEGRYIVDPPRRGPGVLRLEWTDALGRVVERQVLPVALGAGALPVRLDAGRAVAMDNIVRADLGGEPVTARFVARPAPGWDEVRVVMYQDHAGARLATLRQLGVDAVKVLGHRVAFTAAEVAARTEAARAVDLRWYVENIATDFYSPYHIWTPEHPSEVHFRFLEAQRRHRADPADLSVFEREPSLSDPAWQARIAARLGETVRAHGAYRPFYYSLADEPGIADLAAAWDFDRSPPALADFRSWLRARHGNLAALNALWGSGFATWDEVVPEGTTAAMARADGNYAAWNDHKAFMDERFAAALRMGREAVHAADPTALAGIEGGQIPGWGGWNYAQVAPAVDVMEIYAAGQNVEIAQALNPQLVTLATLGGTGPGQLRAAWRALLNGASGFILWDEAEGLVAADGRPGPWAAGFERWFGELDRGLGALLLASRPPERAPVAVLYSPESFRLGWLQEHRAAGDAWSERNSEIENEETEVRVALRRAAAAVAALGLPAAWVTERDLIERASRRGTRIVILPRAIALSDAAVAGLRGFIAAGGTVLTDGPVGTHDTDLRPRPVPVTIGTPLTREALVAGLRYAPPLTLARSATRPPTLMLRAIGDTILIGALSGQDATGIAEAPAEFDLAGTFQVRDLRGDGPWHEATRLTLRLDGDGPALFAVSPHLPPAPSMIGPERVRAGETAKFALRGGGVLRIEVRDPAGRLVRAYSGNAQMGRAPGWAVPFALNDPPGRWTVMLRDPLEGTRIERTLDLLPP